MSESCDEPGGDELLVVGRVIRPHGIRGAVIVAPESDWPERFSEGASLLMEAPGGRCEHVTVESAAPHKGKLLVYLSGVGDRDTAEELKGRYLLVRARYAAPLGENEYWAHDLVGMSVVEEDGRALGEVGDVICGHAQDLLVVRGVHGEFQVPFVGQFVKSVDTGERVIVVKVIEGMVP